MKWHGKHDAAAPALLIQTSGASPTHCISIYLSVDCGPVIPQTVTDEKRAKMITANAISPALASYHCRQACDSVRTSNTFIEYI